MGASCVLEGCKKLQGLVDAKGTGLPKHKVPQRFFKNLNVESLIKLTNASSLEQNVFAASRTQRKTTLQHEMMGGSVEISRMDGLY